MDGRCAGVVERFRRVGFRGGFVPGQVGGIGMQSEEAVQRMQHVQEFDAMRGTDP